MGKLQRISLVGFSVEILKIIFHIMETLMYKIVDFGSFSQSHKTTFGLHISAKSYFEMFVPFKLTLLQISGIGVLKQQLLIGTELFPSSLVYEIHHF